MVADVVRGVRAAGLRCYAVDDGSDDDTGACAASAGATLLVHPVNRGKGAALRTGVARARADGHDCVVALDADGQHDPASIPALLAAAAEADLVIGCRRRDPSRMPWTRRCTNGSSSFLLSRICGRRFADTQSGYRAYGPATLDLLPRHHDRYDAESEWLVRIARAGLRIAEVPIATLYGPPSRYRAVRDTLLIAAVIVEYL
jgi:glycosyltransferase involved in cell wall biosynthesis